MKTEDLAVFVTVADLGSQSATARTLNIPTSKVCRTISQLEDQLGARLFERTTRRLSLTESGSELLERSRDILSAIDELENSIGQRQKEPEGEVTIAAPLDFINQTTMSALVEFMAKYPKLQLRFISYQSQFPPTDVHADIILYIDPCTPPDSSLIARKLITAKRHFIASPEFIKSNPGLKHPADLVNYPCLITPKGSLKRHQWVYNEDGSRHTIKVTGPLQVDNVDMCVSAALYHQGVFWLPDFICAKYLQTGQLVHLFDRKYPTEICFWALYPSRRYVSYRTKLVLNFLEDHFTTLSSIQD